MTRVLVIGATGSIGRVVVPTLVARGLEVVAFVRDQARGSALYPGLTLAVGDVRDPASVAAAVAGADAVVMTHGGADGDEEGVDYGAVAAVLAGLAGTRPRIALMTSMGVSKPTDSPWVDAMHWKRRGERLLRASGVPYTIVRPGWFDYEAEGHRAVLLEQGDTTNVNIQRGVARQQIADALVNSLLLDEAVGVTFEIFAGPGEAQDDWAQLFGALAKDGPGALDGALDVPGPAPADEPDRVRRDIAELGAGAASGS
jgi:uncharacterized protein YbjT (DUF2867 family)